nr:translation initiation factor IF-2-like [Pongo abelii]
MGRKGTSHSLPFLGPQKPALPIHSSRRRRGRRPTRESDRGLPPRGRRWRGSSWRPRLWSRFPSLQPEPQRRAPPSPQSPAGSGLKTFSDRAELARRPQAAGCPAPPPLPSPTPRRPDPTLPGGREEGGAGRQQPLPGTRRRPRSSAAFGANSSPRRQAGGRRGWEGRGAGRWARPGPGWDGGARAGTQGLPLPGTEAEPGALGRSLSRGPVPRQGSLLSARVGWRLHHRYITSIQDANRAPAALQVWLFHLEVIEELRQEGEGP